MSANSGDDLERLNFVPREICVVVPTDDPADSPEWHERVRRELNDRIAAALETVAVEGRDRFERDLAPIRLKRDYQGNRELLQPLERSGYASSHQGIHLPRSDSRNLTVSCFHLGRQASETAANDRELDVHVVRELVNLINRHLVTEPGHPPRGATLPIAAATPNWLTGATADHSCGGPASLPEAAETPGRPTIRFPHPELSALVEGGRARAASSDRSDAPVVVALLDTSPSRAQVERAAERYPRNGLLREVYRRVSLDGPLALEDAHFRHLHGIVVNWHDGPPARQHDLDAYRMPDHGLFSAGIVQDVAPFAEIHLIRALNDHGVGDLQALIRVLRALPDRLPTKPGQRLIVNLSLMVDVPPRERLLPRWFPELSQDPAELRRRGTEVESTLTFLDRALRETISWLNDRGILVVAAAGNDALNLRARPEPRHPARFDNVFGVAAVNRRGEPSAFSNRGDERVLGNGVATFGGNARRRRPGEPPRIEPVDGQPDALVGIFSGEELPLGGGRNTTGWVYWSGTSFATPIVSAVAANVWAAEPALSPGEVIRSVIQRYASHRNRDLDCPVIAATQE